MSFDDNLCVGELGEELAFKRHQRELREYLQRRLGIDRQTWNRPPEGERHFVDRTCTGMVNGSKLTEWYMEAKTKWKRVKYGDTGFDWRHFVMYRGLHEQFGKNTFVLFVDDQEACIYGGWLFGAGGLSEAREAFGDCDYPRVFDQLNRMVYALADVDAGAGDPEWLLEYGIILFPRNAMEAVARLTDAECRELAAARNPPSAPVAPPARAPAAAPALAPRSAPTEARQGSFPFLHK